MKTKTESEIKDFCQNYLGETGIRIEEVTVKKGKDPVITLFIDKEGGVSLDDCEKVSNILSDPLDELDPTFGAPYTFNVSSLGADRPFKTDADFNAHIGKMVEVKLYAAVKGKKFYEGVLTAYDGVRILLKTDEKTTLSFDLKSVIKVSEYIDFN
ncbi:MAG: ribosome maturation factor RimP [Clostridia bacterium]|nr:ribosome maturation factor RimP [Clostridia bacterium]